ncbi:MAG: 30S ribosomal protein S4 [Nitrososphaeraceae archaeon]|nr:30S ribosomal protein S4 [Nitrososphaeraceae archaeon]
MGDPKKFKKTYRRPRRIWTTEQLNSELYLVGSYGLRSKRELWKAQTEVARLRNQARALLALTIETRQEKEKKLLSYLQRIGLVSENSTLDDVLNLKIEDILERRLQSIVMRKGHARTSHQARQIVVHGHVMIGDRIVNIPGYVVKKSEESTIMVNNVNVAKSSSLASESNESAVV